MEELTGADATIGVRVHEIEHALPRGRRGERINVKNPDEISRRPL